MPLKSTIEFLKSRDELKTAEILLDTFAKYSNQNFQYDNLAQLYYEIKAYRKSEEFANKSLTTSTKPEEQFAARCNLAKIYNHLNEPLKALENIKVNLFLNPNYELMMEEIFSHYLLGEHEECERQLRELKEDPNIPSEILYRINFNLGTYEMDKGDFKEGFKKFTRDGRKVDVFKKLTPPENLEEWSGNIEEGKKILILHRGGIGDEIINVRFMKLMEKKGLKPLWVTSTKDLKGVFNRNGLKTIYGIQEFPEDDNIFEYEFCSSMDLPYILDLDKKDLGREPYIVPSLEYVEKWSGRIKGAGIGIKWSGNPLYEHDLHRSLSIDDIMSVLGKRENIVSLQKEGFEGLEKYPEILDLHSELESIEDTLAIIWLLDSVITSCTSIAHMAACMGKKVYVIPPISCYYVWLGRKDEKSDWYGDYCTVLRQRTWNSWKEPLEKLKEKINE